MHDVECLLNYVLLQTSKDNMLHLIQWFMFLLELYMYLHNYLCNHVLHIFFFMFFKVIV